RGGRGGFGCGAARRAGLAQRLPLFSAAESLQSLFWGQHSNQPYYNVSRGVKPGSGHKQGIGRHKCGFGMAFHPLRTFQKNRKFWMASILLVCMITFVLCTGFTGGDFGSWLLGLFGRNRGDAVATIDNRTYYTTDLSHLREQRDIANEYMRKALEISLKRVQQRLEEPQEIRNEADRVQYMRQLQIIQQSLLDKWRRPRHFCARANELCS